MVPPIDLDSARAQFRSLADGQYQWWLRLPIINLLWRRDYIRFAFSLEFLVSQILDGVYLLNRLQREHATSDRPVSLEGLSLKPDDLRRRIEKVCSLEDLHQCEQDARALLLETVSLGHEYFHSDFGWLERISHPCRALDFRLTSDPARHLALARELADAYRKVSSVVAVAVGESVSNGLADETSDLDLEVICREKPEEIDRWKVVRHYADDPNDARVSSSDEVSTDEFFARGILVDTRYWHLPAWASLAKRPVPKSSWQAEVLSHLDSMRAVWDPDGIVRTTKVALREATARLRPERLSDVSQWALRNVEVLKELSRREAARHDLFSATLSAMGSAFDLLAALNDTWIVFPKWARQWLAQLPMAVPQLCERFERIILKLLPDGRHAEVFAALEELLSEIRTGVR